MRFWFVKGDNSVVSARPYEVKAPRFNLRGLVVRDSFAGVKFISFARSWMGQLRPWIKGRQDRLKRGAPSTRRLRMDVIWANSQKMVIQTE